MVVTDLRWPAKSKILTIQTFTERVFSAHASRTALGSPTGCGLAHWPILEPITKGSPMSQVRSPAEARGWGSAPTASHGLGSLQDQGALLLEGIGVEQERGTVE